MADDILSQEEVDALLRGVTGDDGDDESRGVSVKNYDIGRQERIVRGRMPTLEIINERFARNLRIGLFNFIRRNAEISVGPVKVQKYSEFIRNLVVPTNLNLCHVKPLRGTALLIFDPDLVFWWWIICLVPMVAITFAWKVVTLRQQSSESFAVYWMSSFWNTKKLGNLCMKSNLIIFDPR